MAKSCELSLLEGRYALIQYTESCVFNKYSAIYMRASMRVTEHYFTDGIYFVRTL